MITKTTSLFNNIISFSKDQLKQTKGIDMLSAEKEFFRSQFHIDKHHLVTAVNIFLYINRIGLVELDTAES